MTKPMFTEVLKWDNDQIAAMTNEEVSWIMYAVEYYEFPAAPTSREKEVVEMIRERNDAIKAEKRNAMSTMRERIVTCTCGHSVPAAQAMSTSRGTACPECYDRMSH